MVPITHIVNRGTAHRVSSSLFEGEIAVYIKGITASERGGGDAAQNQGEPEYFKREDRQAVTWSIQVKGVLLEHHFFLSSMVGSWKLLASLSFSLPTTDTLFSRQVPSAILGR